MNILIRFEDTYGCKTLFEDLHPGNCIGEDNITSLGSFGGDGMFKVSKKECRFYDLIFLVFDLDDNVNFSLTGNALKKKLKGRLLSDALLVKDYCREKIVLIPVYFCFETLYLFSSLIRDCIKLSSASDSILSLYRRYYDYSLLSPEDLVGFRGYAEGILRGVELLTGQKSSHSIFYPQMFHQSYVKHVLKLLYSDFYDFDSGFKNTEAFSVLCLLS